VYSYSKYFGATGWRLGAIAIHEDNVFDRLLGRLDPADLEVLDQRYAPLTLEPRKIKLIDRLVAESRAVALSHAAGLSLPQQCQMLLFSAYCLLDREERYKHLAQGIIHERLQSVLDGVHVVPADDGNRVGYYAELDVKIWAEKVHGPDFGAYLEATVEPTDILFRLADRTGIVLLNGSGFDGPAWSVRVSLANLDDEDYGKIGRAMLEIAEEYVAEWRASTGS
jgi:aspartate 4-decarboxylase